MSSLDGALPRVFAQLERFRRRLILVAFFRALPLALAIALGVAMLLTQIAHLAANATVTAVAIGSFGGFVAASFIALRRTGSLPRVAATLDCRFGLANRLATALAFASHHDGMTTLIAEDADVALRRRRPQDIAFEAPRHLTWIVVGAAVVVVVSLVAPPSPTDSDASVASQGVLGADASASPSTGRRAVASPPSSSGATEAAPRAAADASGRRTTATPSSESNRLSGVDEPASRQAPSTEPAAQSVARAGEPRRNSAGETTRTPGESNGTSAGPGRDGRASANTVSQNQAQAARGDLGGAVGANVVRSTTTRAGGVRGTGAEPSANSDKQRIAGTDGAATTPIAMWDRAESAIERDHLPLGMRTYVHDYLVAIKSGGLP